MQQHDLLFEELEQHQEQEQEAEEARSIARSKGAEPGEPEAEQRSSQSEVKKVRLLEVHEVAAAAKLLYQRLFVFSVFPERGPPFGALSLQTLSQRANDVLSLPPRLPPPSPPLSLSPLPPLNMIGPPLQSRFSPSLLHQVTEWQVGVRIRISKAINCTTK